MSAIVQVETAPAELRPGLAQIARLYPGRFGDGVAISFMPSEGLDIELTEDGIQVGYRHPTDAFRALGLILGDLLIGSSVRSRSQRRKFDSVAVMLDCSRNAVPTTAAAADLLRSLALMGVTQVWLYLEDTYEVPGEPFFGYGRARLTASELTEIDDVAHDLGIEVISCVQTLGHLGNVLKWPAFSPVRDTGEVLLADSERTYELIRTMLTAASGPLRSRRIHIGLDETWGLGSGLHRQQFGSQPATEIFARHLRTVVEICRDLGLAPMMWSDMVLRFASPTNGTSDLDVAVPAGLASALPADVTLVYWDYNHPEADYHEAQIARHRSLGKQKLVVAGAVHTWLQKWANLPNSIRSLSGQLEAAARTGVRDVVVTLWGNDGSECDFRSALPAVQAFADFCYTGQLLSTDTASGVAGSCDATAEAWFDASAIDLPGVDWGDLGMFDATPVRPSNAASWILWADPLLDLVEIDVRGADAARYTEIADHLERRAATGLGGDELLAYPALLARVLALKVDLHRRLRPAYASHDLAELEAIDDLIGASVDAVALLRDSHRQRWYERNKVTGWEILERRYAGLISRFGTLQESLREWRGDPGARIESLERPRLPLRTHDGRPLYVLRHDLVANGSLTTT